MEKISTYGMILIRVATYHLRVKDLLDLAIQRERVRDSLTV